MLFTAPHENIGLHGVTKNTRLIISIFTQKEIGQQPLVWQLKKIFILHILLMAQKSPTTTVWMHKTLQIMVDKLPVPQLVFSPDFERTINSISQLSHLSSNSYQAISTCLWSLFSEDLTAHKSRVIYRGPPKHFPYGRLVTWFTLELCRPMCSTCHRYPASSELSPAVRGRILGPEMFAVRVGGRWFLSGWRNAHKAFRVRVT